MDMPKSYNPQAFEIDLYRHWEESGLFVAPRDPAKKPFTLVMPPPNITGQLHMGHAMNGTYQDILTRYHRMLGEATLWLPGTDHASIATETKLVQALAAEGLTKEGIGREAFLERAWQWTDTYRTRIATQFRRLGTSCDWSRERFTMDEGLSHAVTEVFVKLYDGGLIYKGERIINWCPECQTALSDAEVEYEERQSLLYHVRYPGTDGNPGVIVATTRPETMLGDTGVAVNPDDPRYTDLVGNTVLLPLLNREIPVVADNYVDPAFGTGAVKMTPAHDPNDFEVAKRTGLACLRVIDDKGFMNENAGAYAGLSALDCRRQVVAALKEQGLLVKEEPYAHNVGTCYRCHHVVEPTLSMQWFVKMQPLAEPACAVVRDGGTRIVPERFSKTYFNWMDNIRDWCISRQLWWGHRIPAFTCTRCEKLIVAKSMPDACPDCGAPMAQEEAVLDTWFSSALWPFSTLGWPEKTDDLAYFYPTSVLVTAYDIIFFWVARMIFSGLYNMSETPFHTVLIHGLVRDAQGRKMSKSLGNGIEPLEIIDQYGADALRFTLVFGTASGADMNFSVEKVEASRNFANKVYNASRFVLMNLTEVVSIEDVELQLADKWLLTQLSDCIREVTRHLDQYDLSMAAQRIYDFAWSQLCDWYIEWAKPRLLGEGQEKRTVQAVLLETLSSLLRMLHPFMPFLTESIWQQLPGATGSIMLADWPRENPAYRFPEAANQAEAILEAISNIRALRTQLKVEPGRRTRLYVKPFAPVWGDVLAGSVSAFQKLCGVSEIVLLNPSDATPEQSVTPVSRIAELFIPLGDLVDTQKEIARLTKEKEMLEKDIARSQGMLSNESYLAKAPAHLIETTKQKLQESIAMLATLSERLESLR